MRSRKIYQNLIRKFQMLACAVFCFAVLFTFGATNGMSCTQERAKSFSEVRFNDSNGQNIGGAWFLVNTDGRYVFLGWVYASDPPETVFTLYVNGTEAGFMQRREEGYWQFSSHNFLVARAGDKIEIRRQGVPFLTGALIRKKFQFEQIDTVPVSQQTSGTEGCNALFGSLYLPTSPTPKKFDFHINQFWTHSRVNRVTLNEPPTQPDVPGEEIVELDIYHTTRSADGIWYTFAAQNYDIPLTDAQYQKLRQGLISYTVYAPEYPNGFLSRHLQVYGINQNSDFEGDGQSDFAVFRPSERNWHMLLSSNNQYNVVNFGFSNDKLVSGDYDADGKTDIAVYQPNNPNFENQGIWQILKSSDNSVITERWGLPDDIPLTMNYDGNNATDIVAFRPSSGTWYIKRMGDIIKPFSELPGNDPHGFRIIQWGTTGDKPLTADFDGDGIDELAVFRPSEGNWYIYNRVANNYRIIHWGIGEDHPLPKDFDGDGRADLAIFRPSNGTWYILNSLDNSVLIRQFGLNGDIPVPADFDKDTVADIAVFRPSNGVWYIWRSADNTISFASFGLNGDIPVMAQ